MMVASYLIGQKKYPINYDLRRLGLYILCAGALYGIATLATTDIEIVNYLLRSLLLVVFGALIWVKEKPLSRHAVKKTE